MAARTFKTRSAALAAVKKDGMDRFPHVIEPSYNSFMPLFFTDDMQDREFISMVRKYKVRGTKDAPWYPEVGRTYRHYKGSLYKVTAVGPETESMRLMVSYEPLYECEFDTFFRFMHNELPDGELSGWMDPTRAGAIRYTPVDQSP